MSNQDNHSLVPPTTPGYDCSRPHAPVPTATLVEASTRRPSGSHRRTTPPGVRHTGPQDHNAAALLREHNGRGGIGDAYDL